MQKIARFERDEKTLKQMLEAGNKWRDEELKLNPHAFDWIRKSAPSSAKCTEISLDTIGRKSKTQQPESDLEMEYGDSDEEPVAEIHLADTQKILEQAPLAIPAVETDGDAAEDCTPARRTTEDDEDDNADLYSMPSGKTMKASAAPHDTSTIQTAEEEDPDHSLCRLVMAEEARIAALAQNAINEDSRAEDRLVPDTNSMTQVGQTSPSVGNDENALPCASRSRTPEPNPIAVPGSPSKRGFNISPDERATPSKRLRMHMEAAEVDDTTNDDIKMEPHAIEPAVRTRGRPSCSHNRPRKTMFPPGNKDSQDSDQVVDNALHAVAGTEKPAASEDSSLKKGDTEDLDEDIEIDCSE
jgi:hypothetical protein